MRTFAMFVLLSLLVASSGLATTENDKKPCPKPLPPTHTHTNVNVVAYTTMQNNGELFLRIFNRSDLAVVKCSIEYYNFIVPADAVSRWYPVGRVVYPEDTTKYRWDCR